MINLLIFLIYLFLAAKNMLFTAFLLLINLL